MKKTRKQSVLKHVRIFGSWKGYIAPNKVNAHHINKGWHLGHKVTIVLDCGKYMVEYHGLNSEYIELQKYLNEFAFYNCNSEIGNKLSFWNE